MTSPHSLAALLDEAVASGEPIAQLSSVEALDLPGAYAVQHAGVALRADRGDLVVGIKLGFTSKAKAEQMGVSDVIVGSLTESMRIPDGGTFSLATGIHPRVEPEIAFLLGEDVDPHDDDVDLLDAVTLVAPALEIIDSRYRNFSFTLEDVVADNTSASGFVIGPWQSLPDVRARLDIAALDVELTFDGTAVASGSSADILGNPLEALAATKRMAALRGLALPAGSIILAGAATAAVALVPGTRVEATVSGLGAVSFTTEQAG